ncbi:MAG: sigma-54 dependent transcriptional regulator [Alphaproteobacteria bacterium]|nr:sigma-54 dependent transcriptional regulator [Alphaproteobacteria bacterium]
MKDEILIVDDEADIRTLVRGILEDEGYATRQAASSAEALRCVAERLPALVILDIWLQGSDLDGLQILDALTDAHPWIPVIMISGHGTIETAVSAIKKGAYDFIEKPFKSDRLLLMVKRALETAALKRENESLRKRAPAHTAALVGTSRTIQGVNSIIDRVAPTNSRVLITGEPGTGKDVAARAIAALSLQKSAPFMVLNCAVLRPEMLEIELFGQGSRQGILEQAHGGVLFLDEVADMPLETQAKIVRVLQEQRFTKPGGKEGAVEVNVRILASTNRDLEVAIREGKFRQDLYYRLNVVPLFMPPLRDHPEDIPDLAAHFSEILLRQTGLPQKGFSLSALNLMQSYDWPGNVRQLRNVVEWVMIMNGSKPGTMFGPEDLPPEITGRVTGHASENMASPASGAVLECNLREAREIFERDYLLSQVRRFGGNISKTAEFVGMERSALHRKLKALNIDTSPQKASL